MEVQEQCLNWKKPSSSKRNFQLTLPVFLGFFFNWGSINLYFMWTSHIPVCSSRALFFHSESLLRHTLEEAGYNEKKEKGKKKIHTRVAMTEHSLWPSQQGWPPRHHGKSSPEPAAAGPLQHSHKKEQHFLTEPYFTSAEPSAVRTLKFLLSPQHFTMLCQTPWALHSLCSGKC